MACRGVEVECLADSLLAFLVISASISPFFPVTSALRPYTSCRALSTGRKFVRLAYTSVYDLLLLDV